MSVKGYTSKYLEDLEKRRLKEDMRAASFGGTGDTMPGEQVKTPLSDTELLSLLGGNGAGGGGGGGGGSFALSSSPVKDVYVPPSSIYDAMKSPEHQNTDDTDEMSNLMARGISFDQDGKMKVGNNSTVHVSGSGAYHGGGGRSYNDTQSQDGVTDELREMMGLLDDMKGYGTVEEYFKNKPWMYGEINGDVKNPFIENRDNGIRKTNNPTVSYKKEALSEDSTGNKAYGGAGGGTSSGNGNGTAVEPGKNNSDDGSSELFALLNEGVRNVIDDTLGRYAANTGGRASSAAVSAAAQAGDNQSAQATDELMALMSGDDGTGTTAGGTDKNTVGTDDELYDAGFVESYLERVSGESPMGMLDALNNGAEGKLIMEQLMRDYPTDYPERFAQILLYLEDNDLITEAKALEMIRQAGMDKYLSE